MKIRTLLLVSLLALPLAVGCAAGSADDAADDSAAAATVGTQGPERSAILTAVHARLDQDFAKATNLSGYKLVFVVHQLDSNTTRAFFRARVMKQDAAGKTHELTTADYAGTEYAAYIKEGLFDGPEVIAALTKQNGTWKLASKTIAGDAGAESYEAYGMGATDVFWTEWDSEFGIPRAWLGLS